jgi:hypothetical protein
MSIPEEIKMGIRSEQVHDKDGDETLGIVMDHLREIPDYYTRLRKMETGAPKSSLIFKSNLMNNPVMAALKKKKKGGVEPKETDAEDKAEDPKLEAGEKQPETEPNADDKKKNFIKRLVALKKKK